jgi:hypothetical protein
VESRKRSGFGLSWAPHATPLAIIERQAQAEYLIQSARENVEFNTYQELSFIHSGVAVAVLREDK